VRTARSRGGGGEGGAEGDTYGMARAGGGGRARVNTGRDVRGAERTCCGAEQKADAEEVVWLDLAGAGRGAAQRRWRRWGAGAEDVAAGCLASRRAQEKRERGERSGRRDVDHRVRKKRSVRGEADVRVMCSVVGSGGFFVFRARRGGKGRTHGRVAEARRTTHQLFCLTFILFRSRDI
jgi:hypothetical protein